MVFCMHHAMLRPHEELRTSVAPRHLLPVLFHGDVTLESPTKVLRNCCSSTFGNVHQPPDMSSWIPQDCAYLAIGHPTRRCIPERPEQFGARGSRIYRFGLYAYQCPIKCIAWSVPPRRPVSHAKPAPLSRPGARLVHEHRRRWV